MLQCLVAQKSNTWFSLNSFYNVQRRRSGKRKFEDTDRPTSTTDRDEPIRYRERLDSRGSTHSPDSDSSEETRKENGCADLKKGDKTAAVCKLPVHIPFLPRYRPR